MNIVLNGSNLSYSLFQVRVNDDLPQNICPFCSHQIKSTHYFILKCQESDKKLRLSLKSWLDANDEDTSINAINANLLDDNISFNIGDSSVYYVVIGSSTKHFQLHGKHFQLHGKNFQLKHLNEA